MTMATNLGQDQAGLSSYQIRNFFITIYIISDHNIFKSLHGFCFSKLCSFYYLRKKFCLENHA